VAKVPSWSTCFPQQTCLPAIKLPTLEMCCLVAVDAHTSLLLFRRFNTVVAETRLLFSVMPSLQRIAHNCPGLAVWASRGAVRASRKGPITLSLAPRFPKCCQPSNMCAGCWPNPGCGSPSLCPEGLSRCLVIGLVSLGAGRLIGADLLLGAAPR